MLNAPLRRNQLGVNILNTLRAVGPVLHPSICEMWDNAIPKLIGFLEGIVVLIFLIVPANGGTEKWNPTVWEDLVLRLLAETIKIANDDEWTTSLGEQLAQQLDSYNGDSNMKVNLFL